MLHIAYTPQPECSPPTAPPRALSKAVPKLLESQVGKIKGGPMSGWEREGLNIKNMSILTNFMGK